MVKWLLEHGAEPNDYHTGLSASSFLEIVSSCGDVAKMQLLLDHGARLHDSDALCYAATRGEVAAAALLLDRGIDINHADDNGGDTPNATALHLAARGGHLPVVVLLLDRGADCSVRDGRGRTARDIAIEYKHADVGALLADK